MSSPGAAEAAAAFLESLAKLPPYTGIVFRGLTTVPAIPRARWTAGLLPTSLDPRVATENFSSPVIAAIISRTGRELERYSQHPDEREVVIPPQAMVHVLATDVAPDGRTPLVVIEQLAQKVPGVSLPPTLPELVSDIQRTLSAAMGEPPVRVHTPGKFSGDFPLA